MSTPNRTRNMHRGRIARISVVPRRMTKRREEKRKSVLGRLARGEKGGGGNNAELDSIEWDSLVEVAGPSFKYRRVYYI